MKNDSFNAIEDSIRLWRDHLMLSNIFYIYFDMAEWILGQNSFSINQTICDDNNLVTAEQRGSHTLTKNFDFEMKMDLFHPQFRNLLFAFEL